MTHQSMVEEFNTVPTWTADAVAELGPDVALPAACRGSGSLAGLDWLADRLGLGRGTRLLDSGAGLGGPSEYAASTRGAAPLLVEPMEGACRAAARLFGHQVVVGDGAALPFQDGSFDAAWSLGVLCTVDDKVRHLAELARVVARTGTIGLLVFLRTQERLPSQPDGNTFPDRFEIETALRHAHLRIVDEMLMSDLPDSPDDWHRSVSRVSSVIERDHGHEDGYVVAQDQSDKVSRLVSAGLLAPHLLSCRAQPSGSGAAVS